MIREQQFKFAGQDGLDIAAFAWRPATPPRKLIILAHGAAEHAQRYRAPFEPIIAAGYVVYAQDHRGHGATAASPTELGEFGPGGAGAVIADLAVLTKRAQRENPGLPTIFFGHSMGSMLGQRFILDHHELLDAFVFSGTRDMAPPPAAPTQTSSTPRANAVLGGEQTRDRYAWLTRDVAEVDKYIADPLCGFALSDATRASFVNAAQEVSNPDAVARLPQNLPAYIFVGDEDPINSRLERFWPLVKRYQNAGLTSVTARVYPGGRHEMLNETNRAEVVGDLLAWLETVVPRPR